MPTESNFAVTANQLTKRFGSFTAVDTISFEVPYGEIFGFLGANGAGKTTAIRILCGLLKPTEGSGQVDGIDIFKNPEHVKKRIGYMSQKFSLYDDLTVSENAEFYGGIYGLSAQEIRTRSSELFDRLGLSNLKNSITGSIPVGMKQRLALGCSALHRPRILFLDEPTSGVDPVARRHFWGLIYDLAEQGTTIFVTTHYMDEAEYCGRVSIMVKGRIVALDSPRQLKTIYGESSMQDVFLKVVAS